eukprot:scaffold124167_cov36-Prasinocladus_malaysianus.AAC.1
MAIDISIPKSSSSLYVVYITNTKSNLVCYPADLWISNIARLPAASPLALPSRQGLSFHHPSIGCPKESYQMITLHAPL